MRSISASCLALLMLASAAHAAAQESPQLIRPGSWEVRSGQPGQPMVGYRLCLRTGGMEDVKLLLPRLQGAADCAPDRLMRDGEVLTWELSCPAIALTASARYTVKAESVEGRLDLNTGTPPIRRQEMISARHAGACAPG